tara:strand:+ start:10179 stop:10475 length:297 start_codon:yes stop_codon:yes gene_type:complete
MQKINPLNVLNQREVINPPEHFTVIDYKIPTHKAYISSNKQLEHMRNWIFNQLDGRFFVISDDLQVETVENYTDPHYAYRVGFEIEEESTFFALAYEA